MGNMFGKLTADGLETAGDRIGGSSVLESGVYEGVVKLAYAGKARASAAQSITVHIDLGGREHRETFWITNKVGENFYPDKKDANKRQPLPGFTMVDDLCLVTTGLPLSEQTVEDKVVALYDFDAKKEVPTNVPVLTDLLGKPVTVAVIRQTVDKQKKDTAGNYVNTGETREENVTDKFMHQETHRTVTELRQPTVDAIFYDKWAAKNTGVTRNKAKGVEGKTGAPARPNAAGAAGNGLASGPARPSLFAAAS